MTATRITLKRGRERKVIVVDVRPLGPYVGPQLPKVGDEVLSSGETAWTVAKVEHCEVLMRVKIPTKKD